MKLGSSRGMDTKRPRGSERSKPYHELRLTRRSQRPYPWPPEQAQPAVSKPCRTTKVRAPMSQKIHLGAANLEGAANPVDNSATIIAETLKNPGKATIVSLDTGYFETSRGSPGTLGFAVRRKKPKN